MIASLTLLLAQMAGQEADLPIKAELIRGERIYRAGKGIDRTLMEDRIGLGTWFDGTSKREFNQAILVTPEMLSRWLGYLNAKERWSLEELSRRWIASKRLIDGRMVVIVDLYALPKRTDVLELTVEADAYPETALHPSFLFLAKPASNASEETHRKFTSTTDWRRIQPAVRRLAVWREVDLGKLRSFDWTSTAEIFAPLQQLFGEGRKDFYTGLMGPMVRAIYLLEAPLPPGGNRDDVRLVVLAPGKEIVRSWPTRSSRDEK